MEMTTSFSNFKGLEIMSYTDIFSQGNTNSSSWSNFGREDSGEFGPLSFGSALKIESAKKVLKGLTKRYERIFMNNDYNSLSEVSSERQMFFNSNLFHFITITDKYEDSICHSRLVANYTLLLTRYLGIENNEFISEIERGALLHDIGKIGIPQSILRKPGSLTFEEKEIVKNHPLIGYEMIEEFDFLKKAAQVVLYHHEQYDGSGYPFGLTADETPLEARIFAIIDTFDALTSDRPYREAGSFEKARDEIVRQSGTQFDPLLVDTFLTIPPEKFQLVKESFESHSPSLLN